MAELSSLGRVVLVKNSFASICHSSNVEQVKFRKCSFVLMQAELQNVVSLSPSSTYVLRRNKMCRLI